jgi:hypothetical protein
MLTAEAVIRTDHPDRYLARLSSHSAKMRGGLHHRPRVHGSGQAPPEVLSAEWSATQGTVTLNWGRWTAQATPGTLTLHAEAPDTESLQKIQAMLTTRLENFGTREHLTVTWQPPGTPAAESGQVG